MQRLSELPPLHRDPFDRMLICQALHNGLTIATVDSAIRAYPVKVLWCRFILIPLPELSLLNTALRDGRGWWGGRRAG